MPSNRPDPIPLVDLARQFADLEAELMTAMRDVAADAAFIRGPAVGQFEDRFAARHDMPHAIGVASGTDALALAVKALGIGPGDEVVTQPNTWISTAFAVDYVGATPVFADIDPTTYQIDPASLERAITPKTKAVIPVHMFGHPAPMTEVEAICRRRGIRIIEDVAQAPLARIDGRLVGTIGDIACYSFYPSKNLGCYGDGGLVMTADADLAATVRRLADYGQATPHDHVDIGINSRLDTLQAAVLLAKLPHLEAWTEARRGAAAHYHDRLGGLSVTPPATAPGAEPVYYVYVVQVDDRDACLAHLRQHGVMAQLHYPEIVPVQDCYRHLGYKPGDLPGAEAANRRILSLPMYAEIEEAQVDRVVDTLARFVCGAAA